MKNLTPEQLQQAYLKLVDYIDQYITGDRVQQLKKL